MVRSGITFICVLLSAGLVSAPAPYTAPDGDLNQDGAVDGLDLQCEILLFSYLNLADHPGGAECAEDADCADLVAPDARCGAGFGPGKVCLPGCLAPVVALDKDGAPSCDDPEADDDNCLGLTPRRITDLNCDGETTNTDFLFLVAVIFGKLGMPDSPDHDGDGRLNFCDDDSDGDGVADADDCVVLDASLFPSNEEMCDLIDNDCDGEVDEEMGHSSCGQGACHWYMPVCKNGVPQVCDPFDGWAPEECDGVDNDCDGEVDEELGSTTCGWGLCEHAAPLCADGEPQECDPYQGATGEECDLLDNDCDGMVDEDLGTTTCGVGACLHWVDNCAEGELQVCDPMEGASEEVCDAVDNDCNGETD